MNQLNSILPASEARANLYQILAEASDDWRQFTVKLRGKNDVVIMSAEEVEGWKETLDIVSDKKLMAKIKRAEKSKRTYSHKQVKKMFGI
ncbi:type II toxin-antitoxin system Phd/YefM family antitoxin [Candidatus Collierbacteria bacterium]|nr:type II toxin-antitoxin system Phd/YefM family antitoxin [Candidatus Collierbacteria bacterium]